MREELSETEFKKRKDEMVDVFYQEVKCVLGVSRPEDIGYDQFGIGPKGEVLFWTPGDGHKIRMTTTKGGLWFRALSDLTKEYRRGGTDALRGLLGLGPKSKIPRLGKATEQTIRRDRSLPVPNGHR